MIPIARRFLIANCPEGEILDLTRRQSVQRSSTTLVIFFLLFFPDLRKKEGRKETKKTPKQLYKKNSPTRTLSKIISVRAIRALPTYQYCP